MFDVMRQKTFTYLAYIVIIIEASFLFYFSITTTNISQFTISLIFIVLITFPIGISTAILLFRNKSLSELIVLGFCTGLPLTAGLWAILMYSSTQIHIVRFFGSTLFISVILLLTTKLKYKRILYQKSFDHKEILLPLIVFLFGFLLHAFMLANNNVPFDCDAQSANYIEVLMKHQGYPAINPFLSGEDVNIAYPPTFHTAVVLSSMIKNSAIHKECMAITVICGTYFVLAVYLLAYYLSQKNHTIAFFAGILTLNRAYLTHYNDGNTTEMLAFLCVATFLIFLLHAFEEPYRLKSLIIASLGGFVFSHAALSQTEVFQWYLLSIAFFAFCMLFAKGVNYKRDYPALFASLFICGICVLPWFLHSIQNFDKSELGQLTDKKATELVLSLTYWHSYVFLALSMIGLIIFCKEKKKVGIYLVTHVLVMFLLIIHWRFLKWLGFEWFQLKPLQGNYLGARASFTSPIKFLYNYTIGWYSLTIAFPIAASYCLYVIKNIFEKIKIFPLKKLKIPLVSIVIAITIFMYFEYKNYRRYPEWLIKTDYDALLWFRENTSYENTLILNSPENIRLPNGAKFFCSYWVPAVSERRAVYARGLGGDHIPISKDLKERINRLGDVFYNIQNPNAYRVLKNSGITHIFISTLISGKLIENYLKIPFLELVHYKSLPNLGTAFIFKVK